MLTVPVRELRNNTSAVVEKIRQGESAYLTANGVPVARLEPVESFLKPYLTPSEVLAIPQADAGLRAELAALGDEASDTVGPMEW
ncbi:MAG: type II toxin-antitoxin system prevent-host-death family antitoxin [Propionibacteriaceae bacterium]|jgi:prevent-host-death family protein|nr:type II toxin-antitoxin system prevent-host-death family antitoxin [Propionibacteriaceae bacterium]